MKKLNRMAYYPGEKSEKRIDHNTLKSLVTSIFKKCDMSHNHAKTVSESLINADLRGIHSHGIIRVPEYVKKLREDGVNPKSNPVIISKFGGAIRVNGKNSMGQIGSKFSMMEAIKAANKNGISFVSLEGSNHCGTLDWYTLMASKKNLIGIAGTNALPTMAPWGGKDKIVGLNPISISFPGIKNHDLVIDTALGQTSHGKIRIYSQKNEKIPDGWAFNSNGLPTIDPNEAINGLIQPIGGFKGIGLAMMVGMLSTLLSNAQYGNNSGNMIDGAKPGADGQFFIAININAFIDLETYESKISTIIKEFKASSIADGFKQVYLPGEIENELMNKNLESGIPINNKSIKDLKSTMEQLNLKPSLIATLIN